jgi:hypothetical protein
MQKGWVAFVWFFISSNGWDMSFHSLATKTRFQSPRGSSFKGNQNTAPHRD